MSTLKKMAGEKLLLGSLGLAYGLFALTFRGPRTQFWNRMMATGFTLGGLALKKQPRLRKTRIGPKDMGLGLASAAGLYLVFQIGDRIARVILPKGASEIDAIYALRRLGKKEAIAARLVSIIGPAEELFWRGVVQHRLMELFGKPLGAVLGTAAYGGAHIVTGNFTLIGAASVAGGYWGALYALGVPTGALIVSHAAWDVVIFLIAPTVAQGD
jgi:membrane protease YdiL (CAAX protease family)